MMILGRLPCFGGVVHDKTFHRGLAIAVRDRRLLDRSEDRDGDRERQQCGEAAFSWLFSGRGKWTLQAIECGVAVRAL
jgi:hypothetical protein